VAELEERLIVEALHDTGGNMSRAALRLGISERIMGLRMKKFALHYREFRNAPNDSGD
jgi:Nif-specific regulatory protein